MSEASQATFQQDLQKLEKHIRDLESGRLDLDEALKRFEDGVALTRKLRTKLDEAEGRIELLLANGNTQALDIE